jgi:hypothetical protein
VEKHLKGRTLGVTCRQVVNGKEMEFCGIRAFYKHVLPHLSGPIAKTICEARGESGDLVSQGSRPVIALTEVNAESIASSPEEIRRPLEEARQQSEQRAAEEGWLPVSVMDVRGSAVKSGRACIVNDPCSVYARGWCPEIARIQGLETPIRCTRLTEMLMKLGFCQCLVSRIRNYGLDTDVCGTPSTCLGSTRSHSKGA